MEWLSPGKSNIWKTGEQPKDWKKGSPVVKEKEKVWKV